MKFKATIKLIINSKFNQKDPIIEEKTEQKMKNEVRLDNDE